MHNNMKEKWFDPCVRAVGLECRELQLRGFQILRRAIAFLAWLFETGGDVSRYFGTLELHNRNSKPNSSLMRLKSSVSKF